MTALNPQGRRRQSATPYLRRLHFILALRQDQPRRRIEANGAAIETAGLVETLQPIAGALLKAYPVLTDSGRFVLVMVRGDHRVNEVKLQNALKESYRPAHEDWIAEHLGPAGFIGPVGADVAILLDGAVQQGSYITGANRPDAHLRGVEPGRDFGFETADVRSVEPGDTVGGTPVRIEPAIEIGNIFKLGTRYSEPLRATFVDDGGVERPIVMGSYGIGPARIAAAAIEQTADEQGIAWPRALAPFQVHLVSAGKAGSDERAASDALYEELLGAGVEVIEPPDLCDRVAANVAAIYARGRGPTLAPTGKPR